MVRCLPDDDNDDYTVEEKADKALDMDTDEDEMKVIKSWAKLLRIFMVIICGLTLVTSLMNLIIASSSSERILAFYVLSFSILLLLYEVAFTAIASQMSINFGFLYNTKNRLFLLGGMGMMCYNFEFFGI